MDERGIPTHDELTIAPAPLIPAEAIAFDRDESERRGCHIAVYRVAASDGATEYEAVYHARTRVWYCTCPAGRHGRVCKHLKGITYWNAYNAAYRAYWGCDRDELRVYERDMARRALGLLCTYRGWEIDNDALSQVVLERTRRQEVA